MAKNIWVNYEIVYYEIIANYIIMLLAYAGGLINGLYVILDPHIRTHHKHLWKSI